MIDVIRGLYTDSTVIVKLTCGESSPVEIRKGVRQGCLISPSIFNLYTEKVLRDSADVSGIGVTVSGRRISNLRYADDIVLMAESQEELQELVDSVNNKGKEYGLKINSGKTKVMTFSKAGDLSCQLTVDGTLIEYVDRFVYLGAVFSANMDGRNTIRTRAGIAKSKFRDFDHVWKDQSLSLSLKKQFLKAVVWPVFTYACETWSMRKAERDSINAFEMCCYRRILRVPWVDHITNETIL